jgi:hypothetical protein
MMSERNAVQRAFDGFGRDAGSEKKSGSWYRRRDEVVAVLNLQKSQYGPRYYLNVGFWLVEVGDERYPQPHKCHVRMRVEGLLPAAEKRINELLNLGHDMSDEERMTELRALLDGELLPLLERAGSVAGLRGMLAAGMLKHAGITGPGQRVLASASK